MDKNTNTIYVSQNITSQTLYTELGGVFGTTNKDVKIYFAEDEQLRNLESAVKEGHQFEIIALADNGKAARYHVVFTTLPVISMGGEVTGVRPADEFDATGDRDVYTGVVSVWDGLYEGNDSYSAKSSDAQWHQRGNSTFWYEKKSWKITFKDKDGDNKDMDFLGLEADDDWILNGIARDDTDLREKTVIDLWNSSMADEEYNHKMSTAKYVELVKDGEYMGVYLLMRRIDAKYLELDDDVEVAKGAKGELLYEMVNTKNEEKSLELLKGLYEGENIKYLNVDNWIDNSLFIDAFYMADNAARYNTFYIINDIDTNPEITITLWDTDFSLGIGYNMGFVHMPETADYYRRNKNELYLLAEIHPDIYDKMSQRWAQLRQGVLSTENILAVLTENYDRLNESAAFARDDARWHNEYGESDTYQAMCEYVKVRMEYLDNCYANGDVIRETGDTVPGK